MRLLKRHQVFIQCSSFLPHVSICSFCFGNVKTILLLDRQVENGDCEKQKLCSRTNGVERRDGGCGCWTYDWQTHGAKRIFESVDGVGTVSRVENERARLCILARARVSNARNERETVPSVFASMVRCVFVKQYKFVLFQFDSLNFLPLSLDEFS